MFDRSFPVLLTTKRKRKKCTSCPSRRSLVTDDDNLGVAGSGDRNEMIDSGDNNGRIGDFAGGSIDDLAGGSIVDFGTCWSDAADYLIEWTFLGCGAPTGSGINIARFVPGGLLKLGTTEYSWRFWLRLDKMNETWMRHRQMVFSMLPSQSVHLNLCNCNIW